MLFEDKKSAVNAFKSASEAFSVCPNTKLLGREKKRCKRQIKGLWAALHCILHPMQTLLHKKNHVKARKSASEAFFCLPNIKPLEDEKNAVNAFKSASELSPLESSFFKDAINCKNDDDERTKFNLGRLF